MKPKTKTHAEARNSHLALQARRDAIVRIRQGEIVEVRLAKDAGGHLIKARALDVNESPDYRMVLVILNKRLRAEWYGSDGRVGSRYVGRDQVLGVVLQNNGVCPYGNGEGQFWREVRASVDRFTDASVTRAFNQIGTTAVVRDLGEKIGYGNVMAQCASLWHEKTPTGEALTVGPCVSRLVPCPGRCHRVPDATCDWCCGTNQVTAKVAEAMSRLEPSA